MISLRIHTEGDKHVRVTGIEPFLAQSLYELPEILSKRDSAAAHQRLYQNLADDDERVNADWHQIMDSDLHHLLASAGEIVARDLTALTDNQVTFSTEHLNAWMSALNQARLILAEVHRIGEGEMNQQSFDIRKAKDKAIVQILVLGYLLQLFVEYAQHGSTDHTN